MRTTLEWARSKFDNAFEEFNKYSEEKKTFPFQYYRAKSNLTHWGNVVDALESIEVSCNELKNDIFDE